jgi:UDP-glucose 4-epimerase
MRITVTGGLGFLGSFICEQLLERGHTVTAIDDMSANVVDSIDGVHATHVDCRHHSYYDAEAVVHCASPVGAVALLDRPYSITHEITDTTHSVARACNTLGIPMLNISTSEVYGFSGEYRESDTLQVPHKFSARLEYAVGKMAGEHTLHGFKDLRFTTIRPFNVTGPRQTSLKGFVLPTFVEQALEGKDLTVFGSGQQERSFTSVNDVARFICDLIHRDNFDRQTVNVGNPNNRTSVIELAHRVCEITGSDSEILFTDGKAIHGEGYEEAEGFVKVPSINVARSQGFVPTDTLDDLIELTIADQKVAA